MGRQNLRPLRRSPCQSQSPHYIEIGIVIGGEGVVPVPDGGEPGPGQERAGQGQAGQGDRFGRVTRHTACTTQHTPHSTRHTAYAHHAPCTTWYGTKRNVTRFRTVEGERVRFLSL